MPRGTPTTEFPAFCASLEADLDSAPWADFTADGILFFWVLFFSTATNYVLNDLELGFPQRRDLVERCRMADAASESEDDWGMDVLREVMQPGSSARSRRSHAFPEADLESVRSGLDFGSEEQEEEPDNWNPVRQQASATGRGGRRKGHGNEVELARTQRDPKQFCLDVYGRDSVGQCLASNVDVPGDM